MEAKMEKDADSMVVKPGEYAASEYSASSEPPPLNASVFYACVGKSEIVTLVSLSTNLNHNCQALSHFNGVISDETRDNE
ncbi:CLUMA_CG021314, isoform A [Clunio marinus]|uniref:CLUMA_CG021314, isoform A n=1 Tax=Clunio marinus TaxID=568069 RepID=A0A1J1J7L7_9DIPT|nr:CLUMA_CG021314, isoform A [Clunio marinus]